MPRIFYCWRLWHIFSGLGESTSIPGSMPYNAHIFKVAKFAKIATTSIASLDLIGLAELDRAFFNNVARGARKIKLWQGLRSIPNLSRFVQGVVQSHGHDTPYLRHSE